MTKAKKQSLYRLLPIFLVFCGCKDRHVTQYRIEKEKKITWQAPSSWKVKQPSSMRLASFDVEGGDCSLIKLPGQAGGIQANVNRWRREVGLNELNADDIMDDQGDFKFFKFINPEAPKYAILASIFRYQDYTLFVKLTGSRKLLESQEKSFLEFCKSIKN